MDIFGVLTLLGGLALFLYGMNTLGDGLVMLSGGKLEKILEKLTEKRILGLLLGCFVTAVIQSSSATTVMVVGFVNSGIMKLSQAVGVIMGANIGTTVTSWILSLSGLSGDNVFINLLKPTSFSPVLALIGVILTMTSKDGSKKKIVGNILLGFAVLMFGMNTMSESVSPLKDDPNFTSLLLKFSNPILGMIAGAVLTAVIQSSSASVGILQALCNTGVVKYSVALPIIMGQNIGTCITALLSAIGANKNAKRAAFIHLYFNLIGTIVFMAIFYGINSFINFSFLEEVAGAAGIAVIHSIFNILCAICWFPFSDLLVKLATLTVRDGKDDDKEEKDSGVPQSLAALDERFLETPAVAIQLCKNAVVDMGNYAKQSIALAMDALNDFSTDKVDKVIELEQLVDNYEDSLSSYLVKLSGRELNNTDSHLLSILLHTISDFERISDHAINITDSAKKMDLGNLALTDKGNQELSILTKAVADIMNMTTEAFDNLNATDAAKVEPFEEVIDDLVMEMKQRHIARLRKGKCSTEAGLVLEDILTNYERVSDHCKNIAVALIEIPTDIMDMHQFDATMKNSDPAFKESYRQFKNTYVLP
jgi:phosphate:Na+ symporter